MTASYAALAAGIVAGAIATVIEMALWQVTGTPVLPTLFRDAHFTAAILVGPFPASSLERWDFDVMLIAMLIHVALSAAYGGAVAAMTRRVAWPAATVAGAGFGVALYFVNLHGFTALFPWFAAARGAVTLTAHVAFGALAALLWVAWRPR